jgi:hypothetical protein
MDSGQGEEQVAVAGMQPPRALEHSERARDLARGLERGAEDIGISTTMYFCAGI